MSSNRRYLFAAVLFGFQAFGQVIGYSGPQLTLPLSTSKPEDRCVLQGRVTNSITGEAVKKANIRLQKRLSASEINSGAANMQGYAATSETDGTFKIENIEPGTYTLSGNRTGYLNTRYGAKSLSQMGTLIALTKGQQMTGVNLTLIPQAVISGKVVDQDGDPVPNAQVRLVGQMWQRGKLRFMSRNGSNTNDLGEYRIANVAPGKYYVFAQKMGGMMNAEAVTEPGKPDVRAVKTFYPDTPSIDAATPIDVKAGQDVPGTDIRMASAATYHIRGKIVGNLPENSNNNLSVNVAERDPDTMGFFMFGASANVTKDHTFDIAGVTPGSYSINLYSMNGQLNTLGHQNVDVGEADVSDVQLALVQPGSTNGQILLEGTRPAGTAPANVKNVHLYLNSADTTVMMVMNGETTPKDDGSFTIENIVPGKYYVNVNRPAGTYLKSVRYGNQELLGKAIDLTPGTGLLTLVFSYGVAEMDGAIQQPETAAPSGNVTGTAQPNSKPRASIVLIPETLNEDGSGIHYGNSNPDGSFSVKGVPPGHYRAYAFEEVDNQQFQNPDFCKQVESKGLEIEFKENDKKQIQLPLISEEEVQEIYTRLGIDPSQN